MTTTIAKTNNLDDIIVPFTDYTESELKNMIRDDHRLSESKGNEKIYFKHLGLRSRIPKDSRYHDLGVCTSIEDKIHEKYSDLGLAYTKDYSDEPYMAGLCFTIYDQGLRHKCITYKRQSHPDHTKLVKVHEETHALHDLRPDNLERLFFDKYSLKMRVDDDWIRKNAAPKASSLTISEKKIYNESNICPEIVARVMEFAYAEKHRLGRGVYGVLDDSASRLYKRVKGC